MLYMSEHFIFCGLLISNSEVKSTNSSFQIIQSFSFGIKKTEFMYVDKNPTSKTTSNELHLQIVYIYIYIYIYLVK